MIIKLIIWQWWQQQTQDQWYSSRKQLSKRNDVITSCSYAYMLSYWVTWHQLFVMNITYITCLTLILHLRRNVSSLRQYMGVHDHRQNLTSMLNDVSFANGTWRVGRPYVRREVWKLFSDGRTERQLAHLTRVQHSSQ